MYYSLKKTARYFFLLPVLMYLVSCQTETGVFEKDVMIPGHAWTSSFRPEIRFDVSDTAASYNVYIIFRHSNAYPYNNIWVELGRKSGKDSLPPQRFNLTLANNDKGWLGSGMDDIYEHRIRITPEGGIKLPKGEQEITIGHIMRKDPLPDVFNVGVRVEKQ